MQIDSSGGGGSGLPHAAVRATLHLQADSATRSQECEVHHLDPAMVGGGRRLQGESVSSETMHCDATAGGGQHRLAAMRPPDLSSLQLSSGSGGSGGARRQVVLPRHTHSSSGVVVVRHCPGSPGGSGGTPTSTVGSGRSTPTAPQSTPKKRADGGAEHLDALFDAHHEDSLIRRAMKRSMANQLYAAAPGSSSVTTMQASAAAAAAPLGRDAFHSGGFPLAAVQRPAITTSLAAGGFDNPSSAALLHHQQGAAGAGGGASVVALQQQQQVQLDHQKQQLSLFLEAMFMRSQAAQGMHAPAVTGRWGMNTTSATGGREPGDEHSHTLPTASEGEGCIPCMSYKIPCLPSSVFMSRTAPGRLPTPTAVLSYCPFPPHQVPMGRCPCCKPRVAPPSSSSLPTVTWAACTASSSRCVRAGAPARGATARSPARPQHLQQPGANGEAPSPLGYDGAAGAAVAC